MHEASAIIIEVHVVTEYRRTQAFSLFSTHMNCQNKEGLGAILVTGRLCKMCYLAYRLDIMANLDFTPPLLTQSSI